MQIAAHGITAGYGGADVLCGIDLSVGQGEFAALLGPNGCGKSTLLRVLSHVLKPKAGDVHLDNAKITAYASAERARRVAFVPQSETANFEFTVRDIVLMGRYPWRRHWRGDSAQDHEIVTQALRDADILPLADRPITELSGGEHRRVLLARALAQQTPLLLLDEPTAHLDITHQFELMRRVRHLVETRNMGALAALHDLNQAAEFCDRLIFLRNGAIIADGPPAETLTPETLRRVYDADAEIGINPATGRPFLFALRPL